MYRFQHFTSFFNSVRKKSFLVASLNSFSPPQFLERIVTADGTWLHHYEPESKAQSRTWKRPPSPVAKKFKSQLSAGEIMLTLLGSIEGAVFISLQRVQILLPAISMCLAQEKKL
jgi:hypothetical protein